MSVHVSRVVGLAHERTRTHVALERFCAAIGVRPVVLLQIPFCAELLAADGARILLVAHLMGGHVRLDARRQIRRVADRAVHGLALGENVLVGVRKPDVSREGVSMRESFAAVRAWLGLVLVRLLMPLQLGLRLENLAAVADKVLLLGLLVKMNASSMMQHVGVAPEPLVAVRAFDGHGSGVDTLVLHEPLSLNEALGAEATGVNSYVEVVLEMKREGVPRVECLLAQRALGRVDLEMLVQ